MGDELKSQNRRGYTPHAYEVLHHEFMQCLGRVGHVNLPFAVSEVGLDMYEIEQERRATWTDLFHDISEGRSVVEVKAATERLDTYNR